MLLTASLLGIASAANFLDVYPPNILIKDETDKNVFRVRLNAPITEKTKIHLGSGSLIFDRCSLEFDANNWNVYQQVKIRGNPQYCDKTQTYDIHARKFSGHASLDQTIHVTRQVASASTCSSSGDPHITTFSGQTYTINQERIQHLFLSRNLNLQAKYGRCNSGESWASNFCNKQVAIRYGSSGFMIDALANISTVYSTSPNVDDVQVRSSKQGDSYGHTLLFPDGSKVDVNAVATKYESYLNIYFKPAAYFEGKNKNCQVTQSGGLCNRLGSAFGNLYPRKLFKMGNSTNDFVRFHNSWDTNADENNFGAWHNSSYVPFWTSSESCSLPATNVPQAPIPGTVLPAYDFKKYGSLVKREENLTPRVAPTLPQAFLDDATRICNKMVAGVYCQLIVDPSPFVTNCINDVKLTGSHAFTATHMRSFMSECHGVTSSMCDSLDPIDMQICNAVEANAGLGNHDCPKNCNGHGKCIDDGCACDSGYFGVSCQLTATSFVTFNGVSWANA